MIELTQAGMVLKATVEGWKINNFTRHTFTAREASEAIGADIKATKKVLETMISDGLLSKCRYSNKMYAPYWYKLTEKGEAIRGLSF